MTLRSGLVSVTALDEWREEMAVYQNAAAVVAALLYHIQIHESWYR